LQPHSHTSQLTASSVPSYYFLHLRIREIKSSFIFLNLPHENKQKKKKKQQNRKKRRNSGVMTALNYYWVGIDGGWGRQTDRLLL
jgi:hypothetical protein